MKVDLVNYTRDAVETLIFTKSTRLNMTAGLFDEIKSWPEERKMDALKYMARTVPSSWEFCDYTFAIQGVTRAFTHQLVRTRTASYAQQAMRIVQVASEDKPFEYLTGPSIEKDESLSIIYNEGMEEINDRYLALIKGGATPEDARGLLPTNIQTNIVGKFNIRTMADLQMKRGGVRTQSEYGAVLAEMNKRILEVHPWAEMFIFPRQHSVVEKLEEISRRVRAEGMVDLSNEIAKEADILKKDL